MPRSNHAGMIAGADPTAPGGMSKKALAEELVHNHGVHPDQVEGMPWPALIDAVIYERKAREVEVNPKAYKVTSEGWAPTELHLRPTADANTPLFIGMPTTKDYIFDGHAGAGPSGSERWMACTASLGAARAFLETLSPNQQVEFAKSGTAARQGTTAHAVAEAEARLLLGETTDAELNAMLMELSILPETEGEAYSDEMAEYVSEYVDLVKSYIDEGREVLIEERVTATIELTTVDSEGEFNLHDIHGSADLIVMPSEADPVLVVGDLKYGEGIEVEVENNSQVLIYALGALARVVEQHDGLPDWLVEVECIIAQPRLGGIKTWTISVDDLIDWQDQVLSPALTEALAGQKGGAKFVPGPVQCQWCPARGSCPALAEHTIDAAAELFDVVQETEYATGIEGAFPETSTLSDERLASLYTQARAVADLATAMKAEVQLRLHRGQQVPGFHLVNYTPPRYWSEQAAEELDPGNREHGLLPEDVAAGLWTEKLVSPTQAEKILGEDYERIKALVVKPDIRPVAAPENDRRKPWTGRPPEELFPDVLDGDE